MAEIEHVRRLVDVMTYREGHEQRLRNQKALPFVTIARQAGAGGRELAKELLTAFNHESDPIFSGWQICDQELCSQLAKDPRLHLSMRHLQSEHCCSQSEEFVLSLLSDGISQEGVVRRLFALIHRLAARGKVILVGRGSGLVTRGMEGAIRVRLVASEATRVERMMRLLGCDSKEARRYIRTQDNDRSRLIKRYFGESVDDPLLYDIVWNTSSMPLSAISGAVIALIRAKSGKIRRHHYLERAVGSPRFNRIS